VEWNAYHTDPHTGEPRQIDVLLKRTDGRWIHVECRNWKKPQSVQWVEELEGRRASLQASEIFAVSASGFSDNAITKAEFFGITLFKLSAFTSENFLFAADPLNFYLRVVENVNLKLLFSCSEVSRSELRDKLRSKFPMHSVIRKIHQIICHQGLDGEQNANIDQRNTFPISQELDVQIDGNTAKLFLQGTGEAAWEEMTMLPYFFRKQKPGETTILATINEGKLPGANAEVITSKDKVLLQVDFASGESWSDKTYCNQIIFAHETLLTKSVFFRHRGKPQFQFNFSYDVA